jgi:predicted DNA-binding protein (UPF0251 family)
MGDEVYWSVAERICTPQELQMLELRDTHKFTKTQIAHHLGISRETVSDTLARANQKLVIALAQAA